jgi:hypothetical protein
MSKGAHHHRTETSVKRLPGTRVAGHSARRRPEKVRGHLPKGSKQPIFVSLAPLYRKNAIHACRLAIQSNDPYESNMFAAIAERWVILAESEEARPN